MGSSFWLNLQVKLGDYKPVVCPTLGSTHGFGDTNITLVSLSDYYVVNEMPVLTSWMHPRSFLVVRKSEDCISDKKAVSCTGLEKKQAIVIRRPNALCAKDAGLDLVILANSGIEIAKNDEFVLFRH